MGAVVSQLRTTGCQRCGRQIAWCVTVNGKALPIDPEPSERGNVYCQFEDRGRLVGRVRVSGEPRPPGTPFMPHFASCGKPDYAPQAPTPPPPPPVTQPDLFSNPEDHP